MPRCPCSPPRSRGHPPVGQRLFKVVGELRLAKLPKLRRQLGPRRGLHAGICQCRTRKVGPIGDLQLPACVVVADGAHLLHTHLRRGGPIPRHGWIRKRQPASPTTGDLVPDAFFVQQRSAKAHRPNGNISPGAYVRFHAVDVRLSDVDLDRRLLPKQFPVVAQDHQVKIIGSDVRSCGRSDDDHRDHVGIALCAFKKRSEPMEGRCRWPPAYELLEGPLVHGAFPRAKSAETDSTNRSIRAANASASPSGRSESP